MEEQTIVINDLLSFTWCKLSTTPTETLLKCLESYYSQKVALDALRSLITALHFDYKEEEVDPNPFVAILSLLEHSPKSELPTFVCRNLNNIPDIENAAIETEIHELQDEDIYSEHKRLVSELKELNKSLSDLSNRLHNFSNNSSMDNDKRNTMERQSYVEDNSVERKNSSNNEDHKIESDEEDNSKNADDSYNAYEELRIGLIANRYQRALARCAEEGKKELKVKKIKPLLFESLGNVGSHSIRSISSPFFKLNLEKDSKEQNQPQIKDDPDSPSEAAKPLSGSEDDVADYYHNLFEHLDGEDSVKEEETFAYETNTYPNVSDQDGTPLETSFRCPFCTNQFQKEDWVTHVSGCHGDGTIKPEEYRCAKCNIYYANKKMLGYHMGFHDNARPFDCLECKFRFYTQKSVDSHFKIHFVNFKHKCPFCYFQAYKLSRVKEHIRSHTGERPYKCPMCDYATTSYTTLIRGHMHSHSDNRDFKCEQCNKSYKTKGKLQIHQRCHNTDKPYKCTLCGKGFNKSYRLTIHYKKHLIEKSYVCPDCDFKCKRKLDMRKHMKKMHRSK